LLRVLEAGEFMRVGSSKAQKTNVRVVAATNLNIPQAISQGRFREDLYYRLNAVPIFIPPLRERKDDIVLLFRKFAADFADTYKMPPIRLTTDAQAMLKNYYWKGNIRQLKNITEQISVIEQSREVDGETLKHYLTEKSNEFLPTVSNIVDSKSFNTEREILYQVLFDMKKDIADLKQIINNLSGKDGLDYVSHYDNNSTFVSNNIDNEIVKIVPNSPQPKTKIVDDTQVEDTEEYVEESLSLVDAEKDMIVKALERYRGKRKYAAQELKISERTLYRKIKEYGLE
jgi:DNA-binding NtrC family response regulator